MKGLLWRKMDLEHLLCCLILEKFQRIQISNRHYYIFITRDVINKKSHKQSRLFLRLHFGIWIFNYVS